MNIQYRSKYLEEFIAEIQFKNRNPKNIKALELLEDLATNPVRIISEGADLFRCRIINDETKINKQQGFYGYGEQDSFIPPACFARDLRANYRYIPYLYCSNDPYTALVEVRPRMGAQISVATIRVNETLKLLDFTMLNPPSLMTESKRDLFYDLSELYSKPVTVDDDIIDYIPTQYIAEYVKNLGYDGIVFMSSLMPEISEEVRKTILEKTPTMFDSINFDRFNVVVFNYEKCKAIKSNVVVASRVFMEFRQKDDDGYKLKVKSPLNELLTKRKKLTENLIEQMKRQ